MSAQPSSDRPVRRKVVGYAKIVGVNQIQLYCSDVVPVAQVSFVLGKLLPMKTDLWIGKKLPDEIPVDWIPLQITDAESVFLNADKDVMEALSNRTRGWFTACRAIVAAYHRQFSPNLEEVGVAQDVLSSEERPSN